MRKIERRKEDLERLKRRARQKETKGDRKTAGGIGKRQPVKAAARLKEKETASWKQQGRT